MTGKVLICDDSIAVHRSITRYLKNEGVEVVSAFTGEEALEIIKYSDADILILDIMLPGANGFDICREIRKKNSSIYIMMLSAKGDETDRIVGLELGADEYVVKPFSPKEVSVRIRRILERLHPSESVNAVEFEGLTIHPDSYKAEFNGNSIELTPKETKVLLLMIGNLGRVVSREQFLEKIWGFDYSGDARTVDTHIKNIRMKLGEKGNALKTVRGRGYKLEG